MMVRRAAAIIALFCVLAGFVAPAGAGILIARDARAAQEQMALGIAAGRRGDYVSAVSYFQEAQWWAPGDAGVYYNLALAEAQLPRRELRAMCWFGAFLAARPATPYKSAIVDLVADLRTRSRENIANLVRIYQDGASSAAFAELSNHQVYRDYLFYKAGMLWLHLDDSRNAEAALAPIGSHSPNEERLVRGIARLREINRGQDARMTEALLNDNSALPRTPNNDGRDVGFYMDADNGYWVGYTHVSAWKRLTDWLDAVAGRRGVPDESRLARWAEVCNGSR